MALSYSIISVPCTIMFLCLVSMQSQMVIMLFDLRLQQFGFALSSKFAQFLEYSNLGI